MWTGILITILSGILGIGILAYPFISKIRRRRRQVRPDGLEVIRDNENAKFDIVAVHGLGAHPHHTWTYRGGAHLLKDLLAKDFPDARILSFAHNCDWLINAPVKTAQQISDRLVKDLDRYRGNRRLTPIVFIGHSFGGIIIKQVLCNPSEQAQEILDHTKGILFLGTPHQGSSHSSLAAALASATAILGSDTGLLVYLASRNRELSDLDRRFDERLKESAARRSKPRVFSFYETMPTFAFRGLSVGLIVDQNSARGGHCDKAIDIDVDHSGLNKCRDRENRLYKELFSHLGELRPRNLKPVLNGNQKFVIEKLKTVEGATFDSHANKHDVCLQDTRQEVLADIYKWAQDPGREHVYWLQGRAGTGKSTIAQTVARRLTNESLDNCHLAASFFFRRGEGDRGKARYLFTTIAAAFVKEVPEISEHVRNAIEADPDIQQKALGEQFRRLIAEPFDTIRGDSSKIYILVIDAIDECDGEQDVMALIKLMSQRNLGSGPGKAPLKFFVTSRPEFEICKEFMNSRGNYIPLILHEIPAPEIERDIALFLRVRLAEIQTELTMSTDWPGNERFRSLLQSTLPLFISAVTACRFIRDPRFENGPDQRLDKFLAQQNANEGFTQTYQPVLNQALANLPRRYLKEKMNDFEEVVGAIITIAQPLSKRSLERLLGRPENSVDWLLNRLHSVLDIPSDEDGVIRIFHQSFRDYLIDFTGGAGEFWIDERAMHRRLASQCLQLLCKSGSLKQDICELNEPGKYRSEIEKGTIDRYLSPEIQYACLYWAHHLKESMPEKCKIRDEGEEHQFLQDYFLYWFESMVLLGKLSGCLKLVSDLRHKTHPTNGRVIRAFLQEAERFILYFGPIADEAPLQIYLSGLIFTPESSIIRKRFRTDLSKWVSNKPKLDLHGSSQSLQQLVGHTLAVVSVAFSPDGLQLFSGSIDGTIKIWDSMTGVCLNTLKHWRVRGVASSTCNQLFASVSREKVKVWDAVTSECLHTFGGVFICGCSSSPLSFSIDGQKMAIICRFGKVLLVDPVAGVRLRMLEVHDFLSSIAFTKDGQLLAVAKKEIKFWDVERGECLNKIDLRGLDLRSFDIGGYSTVSTDARLLATTTRTGHHAIWEPSKGMRKQILEGSTDFEILGSALSADSMRFAAPGMPRGTIKIWDTVSGACLQTLRQSHTEKAVGSFSPDGKRLVLISTELIEILHIEERNDEHVLDHTVTEPQDARCPSVVPGNHAGRMELVAVSVDGQQIASVSGDTGDTIMIWDSMSGACLNSFEIGARVNAVAFIPGSHRLAVASITRGVEMWDSKTGNRLYCHKRPNKPTEEFVTSPDDRDYASSDEHLYSSRYENHPMNLWAQMQSTSLQTFEKMRGSSLRRLEFNCHIFSIASSSDGQQVALGVRSSESLDLQENRATSYDPSNRRSNFQILIWNWRTDDDSDDDLHKIRVRARGNDLMTSKIKMRFSPDDSSLFTSIGTVDLQWKHDPNERSILLPPQGPFVYTHDDGKRWFVTHGERVLRIPSESKTADWDAAEYTLAMIYQSSHVMIIQFKKF